ncbi:MAG: Tol-Pal system beta propeller repeat protein TolB [Gammaproteobacteria bacterium]
MTYWFLRRCCAVIIAVLLTPSTEAALDIKITQGVEGALPIAVVPFGWTGSQTSPPTDIAGVIAADLERSGRFAPVPRADLPAEPHDKDAVQFNDWRLRGTGNLVIGSLASEPNGTYTVAFRLFDVFRGVQLTGLRFSVTEHELRSTAHRIADLIYEELTGEPGAFATRIAYITEYDGETDAEKSYALQVADSDGENARTVVEATQPLLSPAWSPDGRRLAYVSFETNQPRVYVQELASGARQQVTAFPGLNSAPAWSPDGLRLALTLSKDGNPEIYILDLRTRQVQRLTRSAAIDTEPAWAPDGRSLVFTSDRGGSPQIYRIPVAGGRAERLTFDGSYNARATFAPDGSKLALIHGDGNAYRVALLTLDDKALQVLSDTLLDESPSFAPNGRIILYATTDAEGATLAAVSIDGRVRHRLGVQLGKVREPAWSPFAPKE